MKKFVLSTLLVLGFGVKSQTLNYTVTNVTGSNSITCATPSVVLSASSNFSAPVSYFWASSSFTARTANVTVTNAGSYTVTATANGTLVSSQLIIIGVNTVAPVSSINPTFQSI